ncbi:DUF4397 domain-containing protein [Natrarchaeobaculum sulfurireducens]|uniref:DUF4397 domain-containing protein n=1 Tax=Natrarchaeobaculum sulfurireducens TaxID=2044521 RepID=A0A346PMK1_9EURY|nr:DUF4397 domain-containing protein [Natrarchaeobaculum sulfurireducens]AXR80746.1 hypothetical protein AArcMg_0724 [Natrarchaeobaculum sulfurireducens]
MTISRRSTIKAIGVVGAGSTLSGTALAVSEYDDDERDPEETPEDEEMGALRVAHFSPDAPDVDVYVDDDQILADVAYDDVSPYLEIAPGTYTVTITAAGDPETVAYEEQVTVDENYYTAAAIGELEGDAPVDDEEDGLEDEEADGLEDEEDDETFDEDPDTAFDVLLLVDDTPEDVQEETANLRFVHASPDAPAVDIVDEESGAAIFEGVPFGQPTGYVPVEPTETTIGVFPADDEADGLDNEDDEDGLEEADDEDDGFETEEDVIEPEDPVLSVDVELEEQMAYTAFAIGYLEDEEVDDEMADDDDDPLADDEMEEDEERPLDVRLLVDGTMEEEEDDVEPEEEEELEPDEEEPEPEEEDVEPDEEEAVDPDEEAVDPDDDELEPDEEPEPTEDDYEDDELVEADD